jgi:hypothetical protein
MTDSDKTPAPPKKATGGPPKSTGVSLFDEAGNTMRITAVVKKDGTASTYVVHKVLGSDGKTKTQTRGATQVHDDMEAARAALDRIKKKAVSAGWQEKTSKVGRAKPDEFDIAHLPKPATK